MHTWPSRERMELVWRIRGWPTQLLTVVHRRRTRRLELDATWMGWGL